MDLMIEETFGPILPIMAFDSVEEAIALANDSIYGLSASVFGQNEEKACQVASHIDAGGISINDASLTISAQDLDFANEATEQLTCNYEGAPLNIAFNAKFLVEMLSVLESEEIKIELSEPSRAGILSPVEETEGEEILMLVMPVMLSN